MLVLVALPVIVVAMTIAAVRASTASGGRTDLFSAYADLLVRYQVLIVGTILLSITAGMLPGLSAIAVWSAFAAAALALARARRT